jgi:hypothetical protein
VIKKPRKNKEAKARYRAVKIQPQWVVTPGKQTNKQRNKHSIKYLKQIISDDSKMYVAVASYIDFDVMY